MKISLVRVYSRQNIGDSAITVSTIRLLRKTFRNCHISCQTHYETKDVNNNKIFVVTNSTIDFLDSGDTTIARTDKPVIGFGKVKITAAASAPGCLEVSKTVDGYVFLYFVLALK